MTPLPRFTILFVPEVVAHLAAIERKHHRLIQEKIDEQLSFSPDEQTANRKPLDQPGPLGATWELRFGDDNRFRVFYEVDRSVMSVRVLGIGIKVRNVLHIGEEEFKP